MLLRLFAEIAGDLRRCALHGLIEYARLEIRAALDGAPNAQHISDLAAAAVVQAQVRAIRPGFVQRLGVEQEIDQHGPARTLDFFEIAPRREGFRRAGSLGAARRGQRDTHNDQFVLHGACSLRGPRWYVHATRRRMRPSASSATM